MIRSFAHLPARARSFLTAFTVRASSPGALSQTQSLRAAFASQSSQQPRSRAPPSPQQQQPRGAGQIVPPPGAAAPPPLPPVVEVTPESAEAIFSSSSTTPTIFDFYASWCEPCKTLTPLLEKHVLALKGAVRLAKVNIDALPQLAEQFGVKQLPTVLALHDRKMVGSFIGVLDNDKTQAFVRKVAAAAGPLPSDMLLSDADALIASGDLPAASAALQALMQEQPDMVAEALAGLLKVALADKRVPDAQAIADALVKDYKSKLEIPYVSAAIAQLHVLSAATASAAGSSPAQLLAAITQDPKDHSSRVALAGLLFASGEREAAVEHLLQSIKIDRTWEGGRAKESLFKMLEALGTDPLVGKTRRRLSAILF